MRLDARNPMSNSFFGSLGNAQTEILGGGGLAKFAVPAAGAALGFLGSQGQGPVTATTRRSVPGFVGAGLEEAVAQGQQLSQAGIPLGATQEAGQAIQGLLGGQLSPGLQGLVQNIFQQQAAPILARASQAGALGGSDFNQLISGLSGDIAAQLFQPALSAALAAPQQSQALQLAPLQTAGGLLGTTRQTQPTFSNPLSGLLGGALAATGLGSQLGLFGG